MPFWDTRLKKVGFSLWGKRYSLLNCNFLDFSSLWSKRFYQITNDEIQQVWHPRLMFLLVTDTKSMTRYGSDQKYEFHFDNSTNTLQYSESVLVTFSCHSNFRNYPFDEHKCPLNFGTENAELSKQYFDPIKIVQRDGNSSVLSGNF